MPDHPPSSPICRITWEPSGRRIDFPASGGSLLDAARSAGVELAAVCGGTGICGGCRVRIISGETTPLTPGEAESLDEDEVQQGFRLACQAAPLGDCRIDVPASSLTTAQKLQLESQSAPVSLDPPVIALDLAIDPPTLSDLRPDTRRVLDAAAQVGRPDLQIAFPVLASFSEVLRLNSWRVRLALRGSEIVAALPPDSRLCGLAVDVGTTKLAAYLLDLSSGSVLASAGAMNAQVACGEDVISRISYANRGPDERRELQERLVGALNGLVDELCLKEAVSKSQVVEAVLVGNSAMHHLLVGLPVRQLGAAPYVLASADPLEIPARDLGLGLAPGAYAYLPPNLAGYVGGDHVAMLLAAGLAETQQAVLALDIGTNTEISLSYQGQLWSCSTASGPAFEGAHITCGMRAAPGAIERVQIHGGRVYYQTIDGRDPVGICGSGILDAVAQMAANGLLNSRGGLLAGHPMVREGSKQRELLLVPAGQTGHGADLIVSRKDINEIQLAKGAIRTGIDTLLAEAGLEAAGLDALVVAGAFGTYLDLNSAEQVGMLPVVDPLRRSQIGNAAGAGARQLLVSRERRRAAVELARRVQVVELTTHPDFSRRFVHALMFSTNPST